MAPIDDLLAPLPYGFRLAASRANGRGADSGRPYACRPWWKAAMPESPPALGSGYSKNFLDVNRFSLAQPSSMESIFGMRYFRSRTASKSNEAIVRSHRHRERSASPGRQFQTQRHRADAGCARRDGLCRRQSDRPRGGHDDVDGRGRRPLSDRAIDAAASEGPDRAVAFRKAPYNPHIRIANAPHAIARNRNVSERISIRQPPPSLA